MRKFLSVVLVILICSISLYSFAENEDITNLQNKQQELQNQMTQTNEELTDVQDELTDNLEQIQKIDEKIEKAEQELEELNKKIEEVNLKTEKMQEKLKLVTKRYEKQKKLLEARLVAIYEAGETQYLDVVLASSDLSDFLSSYVVLNQIATYDKDLLEDVEEQKQIMEIVNERLQENLEQLSIMKKNQTTNTKILQNTKILRESYTAKLSTQELEIQTKIDEYKAQFAQVNKEILEIALSQGLTTNYVGGQMTWPVPGYTQITSNYGMRTHPITGVYKLHTGVDISAPIGTNFVAANDGIVTKAYFNSAYGNMVMIDHGGGISTLYAHGSEILVQVGQTVSKGDPILKVGSTGYSTGPHAHFEVRINGIVTDPIEYITGIKIPSIEEEQKTDEINS